MALIPRKVEFFDLLEQQADIVVQGAKQLVVCLEGWTTRDALYLASKEIHEVEHAGDNLVHEVVRRLNQTFITPFDREDIYELTVRLDDVLDYVDAVAKRLVTFQIDRPTAHCLELARIISRASVEVAAAVRLLRNMRESDKLLEQCQRINQFENDGDQVLREALTTLFQEPTNPLDVIKWMNLYEHLEIATDKAEDVANILESVVVKYS